MSICGRAAIDPDRPLPLERLLQAGKLGASPARQWSGAAVSLGATDDAELRNSSAGHAAVFDGRLDNRPELLAALGIAPCDDAALALAAFQSWGDDFADRLIGDFSCVVWDTATRRLLMTTDPGAMRPLHYWQGAGEVRFATEARALAAEPDIGGALDADRVARWLCLVPGEEGQSFFQEVRRVSPGSTIIWQNGSLRSSPWWRPESIGELRVGKDADYVEALTATFSRAVSDRCLAARGIASHLSGGLDSSAVTAFAAREMKRAGARLTAFTAAPSQTISTGPGQFADEWDHAAAIATRFPNIDHVGIANDDRPLFEVLALREGAQDSPMFNPYNSIWVNGIEREAAARGLDVMLTGAMGNMTLSYAGGEVLAAQWRAGAWRAMIGTLASRRRSDNASALQLASALVGAVLPGGWRRRARRLAGRAQPSLIAQAAIRPEFLEASGLADAIASGAGRIADKHRGDGRAIRLAMLRQSDVRGDYARASRRLHGIDTRDPTVDRRLIELCLSIPEAQFSLGGEPRSLARRMLRGMLPSRVVDERRKGLQAADWASTFAAALPAMRAEIAVLRQNPAAAAWLDLDRMERSLSTWGDGVPSTAEHQLATTRAIALGRFIRSVGKPST